MKYELRHVRALLCIADELNFSHAAKRMHTSQSALSRTIRDLESALDVQLVKRSTRRVELTEAGRAFLAEAKVGLGHIERAGNVAWHAAEGTVGELKIAYNDFAIIGKVPALIKKFRQTWPQVRLLLEFIPTSKQKEALLEEAIDLGFLIGPFDAPNVGTHLIDEDSYVALLPEEHRLAKAESLCLSDLAREPFVLGTSGNWRELRERLFTLCRQAGYFPVITQEASNSEGIFGLVAAGMGVSVYSSCVRNIERKGVVVRPLDDVVERIPICAAWIRGLQSPALGTFVQFIQNDWESVDLD